MPLMQYTAAKRRSLLSHETDIEQTLADRWKRELLETPKLNWKDNWKKPRVPKEAGFVWALWHRAIAINSWRSKWNPSVDNSCPFCTGPILRTETSMQRFWECPTAQRAWSFAELVINCFRRRRQDEPWHDMHWQQCLFSK